MNIYHNKNNYPDGQHTFSDFSLTSHNNNVSCNYELAGYVFANYCSSFFKAYLIQQAHSEKHIHNKVLITTEFLKNKTL